MARGTIRRADRRRVRVGVALLISLVAAACNSSRDQTSPSTTIPATVPATTPDGGTVIPTPAAGPLGLRLSQGQKLGAPAVPTPVIEGAPLDQSRIDEIFARLPEWRADAGDLVAPFNWPTETLAPPRTGRTVDIPFPEIADTAPPDVPVGPLEVLRRQPEGDVPIAPFVSITFNQPMVALATLAQLDQASVPATIAPPMAGRWQWIGTRTLRFDATSELVERLPMATEYTVTVPAGTTSATGGVLAADVSWDFATPAARVLSFQPTDNTSLALEPVFLATFDQRIDPAAVLATITLTAGDTPRPLRLATQAEIDDDESVRQAVSAATEGRWMAFRATEALPADSAITVEIGPGTPSAEGPLTTTGPVSFTNRTYAPLQVVGIECGFGPQCPPSTDLNVSLNNPIDAEAFDPSTIRIDPQLDAGIGLYGSVINIRGATTAETTYTVTIPKGLRDIHGQTLAADRQLTIRIGRATPMLSQTQPLVTLDPLAESSGLTVTSVGHDRLQVRVFRVAPDDWSGFMTYLSPVFSGSATPSTVPDWPELLDSTVDVAGDVNALAATTVDLAPYLTNRRGHLVVVVESTETYDQSSEFYWSNRPIIAWVQGTSIGLDSIADNDDMVIWATDLATGAPLDGVSVATGPGASTVTTDADGLARAGLGSTQTLVATKDDDIAILPAGFYGEKFEPFPLADEARWYVFDDRQTYRPGETVSLKGWVRRLSYADAGRVQLFADAAKVKWTGYDTQGNPLATGTTDLNPLGGFDLTFDVLPAANLGYAYVDFELTGVDRLPYARYQHGFQIQEFRRPEFEVTARNESPGPYTGTAPATVAVDATYFAGGPLPAAPVEWQVTTSAATYSPPGWDRYTFGIWQPWWYGDAASSGRGYPAVDYSVADEIGCCFPGGGPASVKTFSGTTDADGTHYLQIDFEAPEGGLPDLPTTVSAQATVTDVNRQALASTTNLLVHPGDYYVGLAGDRTFVRQGDPLTIEAIVSDIDGTLVGGRSLTITATRMEWRYANGGWSEQPASTEDCPVTSGEAPVSCRFATPAGGTYQVTSTVTDDHGGHSRSQLTRWVGGGDAQPTRNLEQQALTIIPAQATYQPGDTAELLVQSPFSPGEGLATISHAGIRSTVRFRIANGSAVVGIPITDDDIPSLDVSIEVVGVTSRTADDGTPLPGAPSRPAFAAGTMTLSVPPDIRTLAVTATPASTDVVPGGSTTLDVAVADAAGRPVAGAELAVVVVDEAVLALSGYTLADPLAAFYGPLQSYVFPRYGRQSVILADPAALVAGDKSAESTAAAPAATEAPAGGAIPITEEAAYDTATSRTAVGNATGGGGGPPIDVRTNFDALAVFEPSVPTDATGHAVIDVTLPDNLTRYRVMVVAVDGADQFGSVESNITARLPLMVRPSAPRFANFGDIFELPVVLQNQTDAPMDVEVALQTANLRLDGVAGQRVTVPANDRVEVRFGVSADQAGSARFRVAAVSGDAADAATVELPVYTPATAEAFATYGVIDDGSTIQPITAPTGVIPQFGGLDITTSSTSLQSLTDAVLYLTRYPYESSDAMASRIMAIAALRPVLDAFDAPGLPQAETIETTVADDIAGLGALQNGDGGFPYWEANGQSEAYNSIQATHALVLARANGYVVPDGTLSSALAFVADIESHFPPGLGQLGRDALSAYALHVRMLAGDRDATKAARLWDDRGTELPLDAIAWLWPVLDDPAVDATIERLFANRAVETAGAANFATDYGDDASVILHSDRRTDGIVLDALIVRRPGSDLIPKVVNGLLGGRTAGRWDNVQENSFILLALKRYFDTYESQDPSFVARVWLGERYAGTHEFTGRSTDRVRLNIPTAELVAVGDTDIVVSKEGVGRLYYRLGLRYAPESLQLDPLERGFVVERTYEGVDDPADVSRDADGTWHIRAGAKVRVRLTMIAESQRTHVALIDPLPAGLEVLNPALATTPDLPADPSAVPVGWWWYGTWFDHQNLKDDRVEAFANLLPGGTYDYSYVARATTPGTFVTPPARAEEIYAPETFGRGATAKVIVEEG